MKGLVIVNTGDGKGKTTAALGLALRAVGNGMKVKMVQFIKGTWKYGELKAAQRLWPDFEIIPMGEGFVNLGDEKSLDKNREVAKKTWEHAKSLMKEDICDILILDEINYAIGFGLLDVDEVISELKKKPEGMHIVLTGRRADKKIIEIADLVTEMKEIKHPFKKGIKAQRGIEF